MKRFIHTGAFLIAAAWTVILLIAYFISHSGSFLIANDDKVHMSGRMVYEHVPTLLKFLSWFFLAILWAVVFYGEQGKLDSKSGKPWKAIFVTAASLFVTTLTFFGWYSGKSDNNYVQITEDQKQEWIGNGSIEKTGVDTYKDKTGVLRDLFVDKPYIK